MVFVGLLISATKLAGVLLTLSVAANAFSYNAYRKRNLKPFTSPIDESSDVLAVFDINPAEGEKGFFFGLATAPAHVEDGLNDAWLQFAQEAPCKQSESNKESNNEPQLVDALLASATGDGGTQQASSLPRAVSPTIKRRKSVKIAMEAKIRGYEKYVEVEETAPAEACQHAVAAWHNVPCPEERLRFWSDPDTELKLAKNTGVQVFRMGIDWTRIMPKEPKNDLQECVNYAALERYKWIVNRVRFYGMKVMLTLFHHSLPPWAGEYGGWKMEKTIDYFLEFTRLVVDAVSDVVDYWVIFNEPHVFCMLTYCAGAWPGGNPDMLEVATSALPTGVFNQAMHWMAIAHLKAYDYIHEMRFTVFLLSSHNVSFNIFKLELDLVPRLYTYCY
ncbi:unnamed protein product [Cuscuta campestris]|uniref:Uncharacterized protein n=1 Tax=Cuscuta campestris TaxID=132261 RepID=A0A484KPL7_9ASTE|nr:unnamed protein product [Cuscuta campestris]